jgi:ethanolamine ammonia-lyase small subunit
MANDEIVTPNPLPNPWQALRRYTDARIALGRSGVSQPTTAQLAFQLAHAQARDAVHLALDAVRLRHTLMKELQLTDEPPRILHSAASNRQAYLQRPDLGRRLDPQARALLQAGGRDLAIVLADGLSALAIERNALPFLRALLPRIAQEGWTLAPLTIVEQGRVAVGDEVGELLGAKAVLVLIGERPGLSSPDSMGLYLTWAPRVGLTDERRNCISNVRAAGLQHEAAAARLHDLLAQAMQRRLTGVALKDESANDSALRASDRTDFLL